MKETIVFYAPVGNNLPKHLIGGGEVGCNRTRNILERAGYKVIAVDKAVFAFGLLSYIKMAVKAIISTVSLLAKENNSLLYVVGFYEKNIVLELILVTLGKISGHKVIYEARNGRLVKAYDEGSWVYKKLTKSILKEADAIFVQGQEFAEFIKKELHKESVYTPNYVLKDKLKPYQARTNSPINLIYFGRVTSSKNIDIVIKCASILKNKGIPMRLDIIGSYEEEYGKQLQSLIKELGITTEVSVHGAMAFDAIVNYLQNAHYFVFPSTEKKEGHSNALTEAMAFGVVPVASTAGFNESVVGTKELIVKKLEADAYAEVIIKILNSNQWQEKSRYCYNRIRTNYTEEKVSENILNEINKLRGK